MFIPFVVGIFLKIFGINQINLSLAVGVCVFVMFVFIYKTARLVLPNLWAKLAIVVLLLSFQGHDIAWFNDVIMTFVAAGIYFLCAYIHDKKMWRLYALGFVLFCLPYLRQQGLAILACFLVIPMILYHISAISETTYRTILKRVLCAFLACNAVFFAFIFLRNGVEGFEILFSSLIPLVAMAQPQQGYPADFNEMFYRLFNYTNNDSDWHGSFMRFLSLWFVVILPCIYCIFRPFSLYFSKEAILNADCIKFIAALVVLSTIVFNYPFQHEARFKVQFGVGIWLFIDALYLIFYNKKAKVVSILAVAVVLFSIYNLKARQYVNAFAWNYYNKFLRTKQNHTRMDASTPYANLILRDEYANEKIATLEMLRDYYAKNPDKKIVFDGELESITQNFALLFTRHNVALAHKFPYYYQMYNRASFMPDINERLRDFAAAYQPVILGCKDRYYTDNKQLDVLDKVEGYEVLKDLGNECKIFVPQGTK